MNHVPFAYISFAGGTPFGARQVMSGDDATLLLLLIGPDKDGKITKQEWMIIMAAEFDRLVKNKSGRLDV